MSYKVHKFLPRFGLVESPAKVRGSSDAMLFFHATHLHAHMAGLYDDHYAKRLECLLDAILDLLGQSFLHLQLVAEYIHHANHLAQACDIAIWDIGHVGFAVEWQHMVLAHGIEIDVLDDDHLVVILSLIHI